MTSISNNSISNVLNNNIKDSLSINNTIFKSSIIKNNTNNSTKKNNLVLKRKYKKNKKSIGSKFLIHLYNILEKENSNIISWTIDGYGFIILDRYRFINDIIPHYYRHNKMESFLKQLNNYGFKKAKTSFQTVYYRIYFNKHYPKQLHLINKKYNIYDTSTLEQDNLTSCYFSLAKYNTIGSFHNNNKKNNKQKIINNKINNSTISLPSIEVLTKTSTSSSTSSFTSNNNNNNNNNTLSSYNKHENPTENKISSNPSFNDINYLLYIDREIDYQLALDYTIDSCNMYTIADNIEPPSEAYHKKYFNQVFQDKDTIENIFNNYYITN